MGLALRIEARVDGLADFTDYEKMAGEYRGMGIYPRGHLMAFIRSRLSKEVLPTVEIETRPEGEEVQMAGDPAASQGQERRGVRDHRGTSRATSKLPCGPTWPSAAAAHCGLLTS